MDNLYYGKFVYLEVFDNIGKNYIGELDLEGKIDRIKFDIKKSI